MNNIRGCKYVAIKIIELVKQPIFTENQKITPSVKIGIVIYPDNFLTSEELLDKSKRCAEKIKENNISRFKFHDSIHNFETID